MKQKITANDVLEVMKERRDSYPLLWQSITRDMLARLMDCSYNTIWRRIDELKKDGKVTEKWTHQHQSYWEAWYSVKD